MSQFSDVRILRLERLESRTLLAGGVFDFASVTGRVDADDSRPASPADALRSHAIARKVPPASRIEASLLRHIPPHGFESKALSPGFERSRGQDARRQGVVLQSIQPLEIQPLGVQASVIPAEGAPAEIQARRPEASFLGSDAPTFSPLPAARTAASASIRIESLLPSNSGPTTLVNSGTTLFANREPTEVAASADRNADPGGRSEVPTASPATNVLEALQAAASSAANVDALFAQSSGDVSTSSKAGFSPFMVSETANVERKFKFPAMVGHGPSVADVGYIDLAPLESFEPSDQGNFDGESWQLDRHTIPMLKQIARRALSEPFGDQSVERVNPWMQEWFHGHGGLIALDRVNLPVLVFSVDKAMIEVGLQSTVALHRSLDLVGSHIRPALSGQVIDAIFASLESVAASETQPVVEPSSVRVPTAVYPALAIVATTIAISARCKRKTPQSNLQFTGGQ